MKNKKLIYLFAFSLSFIFSLFYLILFNLRLSSENVKPVHLYMNQVGLYKESTNAEKVGADLKNKQLDSYIYKNKDVYVVVSGVSEDKETNSKNGEQLKQLSYSYVLKDVKIQDVKMIDELKKGNVENVLEMIANQS